LEKVRGKSTVDDLDPREPKSEKALK